MRLSGSDSMALSKLAKLVCVLSAVLLTAGYAAAQVITVDTAAFAGTSVQVAFDFIDGGPPDNSVVVSDFVTDGHLGAASSSGAVAGMLPGILTLSDATFFNEYLADITLGTFISFQIGATSGSPATGSFPDAFSFFLLNMTTGLPLFGTTDPTGADSLLTLAIDGSTSGAMNIYSGMISVSAVPEPESKWLLLGGALIIAMRTQRRNGCESV